MQCLRMGKLTYDGRKTISDGHIYIYIMVLIISEA